MIERMLQQLSPYYGRVYNEWYDEEKGILRQVFIGQWSWMDYFWALTHELFLLTKRNEPVTILYDLSDSETIPEGIWLLGKFEWVWNPDLWPPAIKRIVVIGTDPLLKEVLNVRSKISPESIRYFTRVDTLEEARELLEV